MSGSGEEMGITLFGKYKVEKILGHGAFAKVYHARNVKTGQSVAIKVISKKKTDRFTDHAVIKREISIMRRLRHPYIVRLFEVLATTAKIYFVMEYAPGGELFSKIARGRFSEDLSRRYFQQLITAVRFYHARGVYHRDLKPENLLLDENWNLKVTDFGLSAVKEQVKSDGRLHTLCGTPAYVAPEILAKKGYDGAKADVWSCGVILFVLNAGYLPFSDRNLMNMYRKIYNGVFKCPKWMSTEMKRFLSRVLDPNPDSRITVEQIISDPWFMIGYNEVKSSSEEEFDIHGGDIPYLNAFNLISFSSGADISGLLSQPETVSRERFVSAESPEAIVTRVADAAAGEGIIVTKKEWGVRMEGEDCNFAAAVEIHRLTEELVVVEVVTREGHDECCGGQKIWKDKIRPDLLTLVYEPEGTTVHN